jgi:uncharacterized protein with von Willebrand factor type A (vWA) domain
MKTKFYKITYGCGCGDNEDFITAENYDNAVHYAYESAIEDYNTYEGYHGIPNLNDIADEMFNREYEELSEDEKEAVEEEYEQTVESWIDYSAEEISAEEYCEETGKPLEWLESLI